jgi:hypothetical protein
VGFKEQIQKDLDTVFFNLAEFAELHRIEGVEIAVVVDDNELNTLKKGQILGLIECDMLIMGREKDFPADLDPGRLLNVDGRELIVANSGKDMGLVEVALHQNRTG